MYFKSFLNKSVAVIAIMIMMAPMTSFGQSARVITRTRTNPTASSFTASYKYEGSYPETFKVFAWIGEYNGSSAAWIRKDIELTTISPSTPSGSTFSAEFDYAALGLASGKTYAYTLADAKTDSNSTNFLVAGDTGVLSCFNRTAGAITCSNGSGNPPQNPPTGNPPVCSAGNACSVSFVVESITAPASTVNIGVTAMAQGGPVPGGEIGMRIGYAENAMTDIGPQYSGVITTDGIGFPVTNSDLIPNRTYYFQFYEDTTKSNSAVYHFTAAVNGDQADPLGSNFGESKGSFLEPGGNPDGAGSDGACGTANGKTGAVASLITGTLCAGAGVPNPSVLNGAGPWSWTCTGANGTIATCTAGATAGDASGNGFLKNPLADGLDTFPKIFAVVYNGIVVPIAIPFLAIAFVYSGYRFVVARRSGSVDGVTEAKKIFMWTFVGAVIIFGGLLIVNALQSTLCEVLSNCPASLSTPITG